MVVEPSSRLSSREIFGNEDNRELRGYRLFDTAAPKDDLADLRGTWLFRGVDIPVPRLGFESYPRGIRRTPLLGHIVKMLMAGKTNGQISTSVNRSGTYIKKIRRAFEHRLRRKFICPGCNQPASHRICPGKKDAVIEQMIREGKTQREVVATLRINTCRFGKVREKLLRATLNGKGSFPACPCGQLMGHSGTCAHRVRRNPELLAFRRRNGSKQLRAIHARRRKRMLLPKRQRTSLPLAA